MHLARAVHFDESDRNVYRSPARTGEWCIAGGFEFSDWGEGDLTGKARQEFANGWLGLETFGRATFVAITAITGPELTALEDALARHFVSHYGAPSEEAAIPVAREELRQMRALCEDHEPNTVLTVLRELTESGVKEQYRFIEPQAAELGAFAVHGSLDE